MELILLLFLISGGVYSQEPLFRMSPRINAGQNYIEIGDKYISEIKCMKELHEVVKAQWIEELNKISIPDMANLSNTLWEERESIVTKYNTYEDEWLMEDGLPVKKIDQCLQHVVSDITMSELNKGKSECLTKIFFNHAIHESYHQRDLEKLINSSSSEQLPFRKFISFPEVVDLIFQNRKPTTWTRPEGLLYEHTKSYVLSDTDRDHRSYVATQNCDWVRLKALQNTRNEVERLRELKSQVLDAVNKQLAAQLVRNWNFNTILPRDRYFRWLEARRDMISQLEKEIEKLRNQPRDALWICKYVTELATNITDVQSTILITENDFPANFAVFDATPNIRIIEQELVANNDSRHTIVKKIADRQENEMRCLSSLLRLVENHRRYEVAMDFIDKEYEYAEIYCKQKKTNPGLIQFIFCNCIGTICVSHDLVALFEEEYVLVKGSDGIYKIVRSGITSKRKVTHCHTLANSSKN